MTEQRPFRVELVMNAPIDTVWQALTTPDRVCEWFGWDYDGIDAEIRQIFGHVKLEPPTRVLDEEDGWMIELEARGPRTVVRAVMPGPLDEAGWDDLYDAIPEGWRAFLEQLRFLLETGPRGRRRTIRLTGEAPAARAVELVPAGQPWHQSRRQRSGIGPDGHLVVLTAQLLLDDDASGPVEIVVSTYGLDDTAFSTIRDRWATRWREVVSNPEVTTWPAAP